MPAVRETPIDLDPGIVDVVALLRSWGYQTVDSGDGRSKPDVGVADAAGVVAVLDYPHVFLRVTPPALVAEAAWLAWAFATIGLTDADVTIEASYRPSDGVALVLVAHLDDARLARALRT